MAYIAMARKWRPSSFKDMVGQEHIVQTLANAIEGKRLHHAFLFTGTRGVGKTTSARILAKTLNCLGDNPLEPCGECKSCKDFATNNPMDILEIDGASNTSVDNIRELIERVQYSPMIGKYKIFIIDEVHMITNQAFNALLKTLEEPPPHVIFIFATTEANKIPQTILSRVQRFDFKRLSITQIIDRLKFICQEEGISTDMEALSVLAEKADGSMRDALTYFDQAYAFTGNQMDAKSVRSILGLPQNEIYFTLLSAIEKHDIASCFQQVEKAASVGIEYAPYLDGFAKFLRNALYIRVGAGTPEVLNISQELHEQFSRASHSFTNGDLLRISKIVTDTIGALRYSSNPRLLVETALARMAWLDHLTDLRKVLSTLQSPNSGEIKKKLATLPPKEQSLEDLNIFDSLEENVPPPPSSQDFIFLENESPTLFFPENLEQDWNIVLEQLLLEGEKSLYQALHETKVFIENPKANPIHLTIAFPLQKDGSFVWDSTIFISSDKSRQKFTSWLEKKLNLSVFLETTSYTPETEELTKKQRISAYEEDLIHEPGLKLLHDLFTIECLNSKKIAPDRITSTLYLEDLAEESL